MNQTRGVLYLISFSLLTGLGAYFAKLTHAISPMQILFFRAILASIFIYTFAIITHRLSELKFRQPWLTILMSLVEGISIFFFYAALAKTTIANAVILTYTAPIFSAILAIIFLKEKLAPKTILAIALSLAGVILVSDPGQLRLGTDQAIGSLYALLGGFFYAAMAISSKSLTQKTTPIYAAFWQYFIIILLSLVFALPVSWSTFTHNLIPLIYLGWAAGGLAFIWFMKGISLVKGQIIQVITMTEVLVATLAGTILLKESLTTTTILGGLLILSGVLITSLRSDQ